MIPRSAYFLSEGGETGLGRSGLDLRTLSSTALPRKFMQFWQLHAGPQNWPDSKHSQYFFTHADFLQLHPPDWRMEQHTTRQDMSHHNRLSDQHSR
jgi:hypothetical protein